MTGSAAGDGSVNLVGANGFSAHVNESDWPIIGAPALVRRRNPSLAWDGNILSFNQATRAEFEWFLASGERRNAISFSAHSEGPGPPDVFPIRQGGHEWEARVTARMPVTSVMVGYHIQSGAERRQVLYTEEAIGSFFVPQPSGSVAIFHLDT